MTDLCFFSQPFTVTDMQRANRMVYVATYGMFQAGITLKSDGTVMWGMYLAWAPAPSGVSCMCADTVEEARDMAEAEARRIAREMLEIARPMVGEVHR